MRKYLYLTLSVLILMFAVSCSSKKNTSVNSLTDVMINLAPDKQKFDIDPKEEILLKGSKGTAIYIPANAFQFEDGSAVSGKINIELKECYSYSDMIAENLETTSYGYILETGGMISINATSEGKQLSLKDGVAFVVGFPKNNTNNTMDLFYQMPVQDSSTTWVPDYQMYTQPTSVETSDATTTFPSGGEEYGGDSVAMAINYPIEMTDDVYYYQLNYGLINATFTELQLTGYKGTLLDYIQDPSKNDTALAREFGVNNWSVNFDVYIDKYGKFDNFKVYKEEDWEPSEKSIYTDRAVKLAEEYFRKIPPFDIKNYKNGIKHDFDYAIGLRSYRTINWTRFKQKFREKYSQYTDKAIEKMDKGAMDVYMFSATQLGWINCDRFWNTPESEKTDLIVKNNNTNDSRVLIIFKDIKSIMQGNKQGDQMVFNNVPLNKKIKVIGISYANGKPTMSVSETTVSKSSFELAGYKEFSLDQLEKELNSL
jgi:hypothetical protein